MPQFRYAYSEKNELVDVLLLPQDRSQLDNNYTCIGCGTSLIAKTRGEKREKHFAHAANQSVVCSEETYLHKLAKTTFVDVYSQCLENNEPFFIELTHPKICSKFSELLDRPCHVGTLTKQYDLTRYYDQVKFEQRDGVFVPDVVVYDASNAARKVYIEIAVTHFLSDEKRKSDNRIIEIPIEAEADIEKIRGRKLTESDASFVNFERRAAPVTDSECACMNHLYYCLFIYKKSGKSVLNYMTLGEIESKRRKHDENVEYMSICRAAGQVENFLEAGHLFVELLEEARDSGFPVKNCFLCKYKGSNRSPNSNDPVFCKVEKRVCDSNEAVQCGKFRMRTL